MSKLAGFLRNISDAVDNGSLLKTTVGNKRSSAAELKNIYVKPVMIKEQLQLSFVYRYPTKDITKNFPVNEALQLIGQLLKEEFYNAHLYAAAETVYFSQDKNGKEKIVVKKNEASVTVHKLLHDKQKNRLIDTDAAYLQELGVTTKDGALKKEMQHKFKQINRYVEIIDGILKDAALKTGFSVVDMGSGKGYLTFALYDHLQKKRMAANVTGIELRPDLVEKCNRIALQSGYKDLHFQKGSIQETDLPSVEMLIALHACDTATDDAIAKGIKAGAEIIICAPCCHKQIRKQMAPDNALKNITKHGILLERQAEMVTDTIRALILESQGYKTRVFDFIDEEDTPKNVLIVGIKGKVPEKNAKENLQKIKDLKEMFGIKEHYLETLIYMPD